MEKRQKFSPEFKREAVRLMKTSGKPAVVVARELGIPRNRLYKRAHDTQAKGQQVFPGSGKPKASQDELAALKRELARVKEEKKSGGVLRARAAVKYAWMASEDSHDVRMLCRTLGVSPSGYYAWRKRRPGARAHGATPGQALASNALRMALMRRQPGEDAIHHSDQGTQYTSKAYQRQLNEAGLLASMSRKGMPYDNADMESFLSSLKQELTRHESFADFDTARAKIFHYLEVFYNRQRLHSSLGYRSPDDYEYRRPVA